MSIKHLLNSFATETGSETSQAFQDLIREISLVESPFHLESYTRYDNTLSSNELGRETISSLESTVVEWIFRARLVLDLYEARPVSILPKNLIYHYGSLHDTGQLFLNESTSSSHATILSILKENTSPSVRSFEKYTLEITKHVDVCKRRRIIGERLAEYFEVHPISDVDASVHEIFNIYEELLSDNTITSAQDFKESVLSVNNYVAYVLTQDIDLKVALKYCSSREVYDDPSIVLHKMNEFKNLVLQYFERQPPSPCWDWIPQSTFPDYDQVMTRLDNLNMVISEAHQYGSGILCTLLSMPPTVQKYCKILIENILVQSVSNTHTFLKSNSVLYSGDNWATNFGVYTKNSQSIFQVFQYVITSSFNLLHSTHDIVAMSHALVIGCVYSRHRQLAFNLITQRLSGFVVEVDKLKKFCEYSEKNNNLSKSHAYPKYGGTCLLYKGVIFKLNEFKSFASDMLSVVKQLSDVDEGYTAYNIYSGLVDTIRSVESNVEELTLQSYTKWVTDLKNVGNESGIDAGLNNSLIVKNQSHIIQKSQNSGELESNFDQGLVQLLQEVCYFEKVAAQNMTVPIQCRQVFSRKDFLKELREHVLKVVRVYNDILRSLNEDDKILFTSYIQILDKKILPGVTKLSWQSPGIKENFVKDTFHICEKVYSHVLEYTEVMREINGHLHFISEKLVLCSVENKRTYCIDEFIELNTLALASGTNEMAQKVKHVGSLINEKIVPLFDNQQILGENNFSESDEYKHFVNRINDLVLNSLLRCVSRNLSDVKLNLERSMLNTLSGNVYDNSQQSSTVQSKPCLFEIQCVLSDEGQIVYSPSLVNVKDALHSICRALTVSTQNIKTLTEECQLQATRDYLSQISINDDFVISHVRRILSLFNETASYLDAKLMQFSKYSSLSTTDRISFCNRYSKTDRPITNYVSDIKRYRDFYNSILNEAPTERAIFLLVDFTPVKKSLVSLANNWSVDLCSVFYKRAQLLRQEIENDMIYYTPSMSNILDSYDSISDINTRLYKYTRDQVDEQILTSISSCKKMLNEIISFELLDVDDSDVNFISKIDEDFEDFQKQVNQRISSISVYVNEFKDFLDIEFELLSLSAVDLNVSSRLVHRGYFYLTPISTLSQGQMSFDLLEKARLSLSNLLTNSVLSLKNDWNDLAKKSHILLPKYTDLGIPNTKLNYLSKTIANEVIQIEDIEEKINGGIRLIDFIIRLYKVDITSLDMSEINRNANANFNFTDYEKQISFANDLNKLHLILLSSFPLLSLVQNRTIIRDRHLAEISTFLNTNRISTTGDVLSAIVKQGYSRQIVEDFDIKMTKKIDMEYDIEQKLKDIEYSWKTASLDEMNVEYHNEVIPILSALNEQWNVLFDIYSEYSDYLDYFHKDLSQFELFLADLERKYCQLSRIEVDADSVKYTSAVNGNVYTINTISTDTPIDDAVVDEIPFSFWSYLHLIPLEDEADTLHTELIDVNDLRQQCISLGFSRICLFPNAPKLLWNLLKIDMEYTQWISTCSKLLSMLSACSNHSYFTQTIKTIFTMEMFKSASIGMKRGNAMKLTKIIEVLNKSLNQLTLDRISEFTACHRGNSPLNLHSKTKWLSEFSLGFCLISDRMVLMNEINNVTITNYLGLKNVRKSISKYCANLTEFAISDKLLQFHILATDAMYMRDLCDCLIESKITNLDLLSKHSVDPHDGRLKLCVLPIAEPNEIPYVYDADVESTSINQIYWPLMEKYTVNIATSYLCQADHILSSVDYTSSVIDLNTLCGGVYYLYRFGVLTGRRVLLTDQSCIDDILLHASLHSSNTHILCVNGVNSTEYEGVTRDIFASLQRISTDLQHAAYRSIYVDTCQENNTPCLFDFGRPPRMTVPFTVMLERNLILSGYLINAKNASRKLAYYCSNYTSITSQQNANPTPLYFISKLWFYRLTPNMLPNETREAPADSLCASLVNGFRKTSDIDMLECEFTDSIFNEDRSVTLDALMSPKLDVSYLMGNNYGGKFIPRKKQGVIIGLISSSLTKFSLNSDVKYISSMKDLSNEVCNHPNVIHVFDVSSIDLNIVLNTIINDASLLSGTILLQHKYVELNNATNSVSMELIDAFINVPSDMISIPPSIKPIIDRTISTLVDKEMLPYHLHRISENWTINDARQQFVYPLTNPPVIEPTEIITYGEDSTSSILVTNKMMYSDDQSTNLIIHSAGESDRLLNWLLPYLRIKLKYYDRRVALSGIYKIHIHFDYIASESLLFDLINFKMFSTLRADDGFYYNIITREPYKFNITINLSSLNKNLLKIICMYSPNIFKIIDYPTKNVDQTLTGIHHTMRCIYEELKDEVDVCDIERSISWLSDINLEKEDLEYFIVNIFVPQILKVDVMSTAAEALTKVLPDTSIYSIYSKSIIDVIFWYFEKFHSIILTSHVYNVGRYSLARLLCEKYCDNRFFENDLRSGIQSAVMDNCKTCVIITCISIMNSEEFRFVSSCGLPINLQELFLLEHNFNDLFVNPHLIREFRSTAHQRIMSNLYFVLLTTENSLNTKYHSSSDFINKHRVVSFLLNSSQLNKPVKGVLPNDVLPTASITDTFNILNEKESIIGHGVYRETQGFSRRLYGIGNMSTTLQVTTFQLQMHNKELDKINSVFHATAPKIYSWFKIRLEKSDDEILDYFNLVNITYDRHFKKVTSVMSDLQSVLDNITQGDEDIVKLRLKYDKLTADLSEIDEDLADLMNSRTNANLKYTEYYGVVEAEKVLFKKDEDYTEKLAADAERDLAKAMPALQAAMDAIDRLDKKSIAEVKAYTKPPDLVMKTLAAVMTVMDKPATWAQAKTELNDVGFINKIKNFDKENISNATLKKITKISKESNFNPASVSKVSVAAGALCQWVLAMKMFATVYREVQPKRLKLNIAQENLAKLRAKMNEMEKQLAELEATLNEIIHKSEEKTKLKEKLNAECEELRSDILNREKLINGLSNEKYKWRNELSNLQTFKTNIIGNIYLLVYIGKVNFANFESHINDFINYLSQTCHLENSIYNSSLSIKFLKSSDLSKWRRPHYSPAFYTSPKHYYFGNIPVHFKYNVLTDLNLIKNKDIIDPNVASPRPGLNLPETILSDEYLYCEEYIKTKAIEFILSSFDSLNADNLRIYRTNICDILDKFYETEIKLINYIKTGNIFENIELLEFVETFKVDVEPNLRVSLDTYCSNLRRIEDMILIYEKECGEAISKIICTSHYSFNIDISINHIHSLCNSAVVKTLTNSDFSSLLDSVICIFNSWLNLFCHFILFPYANNLEDRLSMVLFILLKISESETTNQTTNDTNLRSINSLLKLLIDSITSNITYILYETPDPFIISREKYSLLLAGSAQNERINLFNQYFESNLTEFVNFWHRDDENQQQQQQSSQQHQSTSSFDLFEKFQMTLLESVFVIYVLCPPHYFLKGVQRIIKEYDRRILLDLNLEIVSDYSTDYSAEEMSTEPLNKNLVTDNLSRVCSQPSSIAGDLRANTLLRAIKCNIPVDSAMLSRESLLFAQIMREADLRLSLVNSWLFIYKGFHSNILHRLQLSSYILKYLTSNTSTFEQAQRLISCIANLYMPDFVSKNNQLRNVLMSDKVWTFLSSDDEQEESINLLNEKQSSKNSLNFNKESILSMLNNIGKRDDLFEVEKCPFVSDYHSHIQVNITSRNLSFTKKLTEFVNGQDISLPRKLKEDRYSSFKRVLCEFFNYEKLSIDFILSSVYSPSDKVLKNGIYLPKLKLINASFYNGVLCPVITRAQAAQVTGGEDHISAIFEESGRLFNNSFIPQDLFNDNNNKQHNSRGDLEICTVSPSFPLVYARQKKRSVTTISHIVEGISLSTPMSTTDKFAVPIYVYGEFIGKILVPVIGAPYLTVGQCEDSVRLESC